MLTLAVITGDFLLKTARAAIWLIASRIANFSLRHLFTLPELAVYLQLAPSTTRHGAFLPAFFTACFMACLPLFMPVLLYYPLLTFMPLLHFFSQQTDCADWRPLKPFVTQLPSSNGIQQVMPESSGRWLE